MKKYETEAAIAAAMAEFKDRLSRQPIIDDILMRAAPSVFDDEVMPSAIDALRSLATDLSDNTGARLTAAKCLINYSAAHSRDESARLAELRRLPPNAEIIARAARGRAECCIEPLALQRALAYIPRATDRDLTKWLRSGDPVTVWCSVFSHAVALGPNMARANVSGEVAVYAVYHRLWQLALDRESDSTEFIDPDSLENIFGLCI